MSVETGKRRKGKLYGRPKPDNPARYERFIEAARSMGLDESGKRFKKTQDKLVAKKGKHHN